MPKKAQETLEHVFEKGCNKIEALETIRTPEEEDAYNQQEYQALKSHQFNLPKSG